MPKPSKPIKFLVNNPRPYKMMAFARKHHSQNLKFVIVLIFFVDVNCHFIASPGRIIRCHLQGTVYCTCRDSHYIFFLRNLHSQVGMIFLVQLSWFSVKIPRLGFRFNRDLDAVTFPAKLRGLTFGHEFDQDIRGAAFPDGLENLSFGWGFDQVLDGVKLPSGLKSLSFKHFFNQGLQLGHI